VSKAFEASRCGYKTLLLKNELALLLILYLLIQMVLGCSYALISKLGVAAHSSTAYLTHILVAFFISGIIHILTLSISAGDTIPISTLAIHVSGFFMIQPLGLIFERLVIAWYQTLRTKVVALVSKYFGLEDATTYKACAAIEFYVGRTFCYVWVFTWFAASGRGFLSIYASIGQGVWHAPYPVLEKYFSGGRGR
jgi:hypothetical protein